MKRTNSTFDYDEFVFICEKWLEEAQTYRNRALSNFREIETLFAKNPDDSQKELIIDTIGAFLS